MLTSTTLNTRRQQRGITLIEVSIGLIIAAIIAAAAFIAFQNNSRRAEIRDNTRQITEIISETKQKIGLTTGYIGLSNAVAAQAAIIDSATELNSYGGAIALTPLTATDANVAKLAWPSVAGDQCTDIVLSAGEGVNSINVAGSAPVAPTNGQFTLANATTICGNGTAPVNLEFNFGRR